MFCLFCFASDPGLRVNGIVNKIAPKHNLYNPCSLSALIAFPGQVIFHSTFVGLSSLLSFSGSLDDSLRQKKVVHGLLLCLCLLLLLLLTAHALLASRIFARTLHAYSFLHEVGNEGEGQQQIHK